MEGSLKLWLLFIFMAAVLGAQGQRRIIPSDDSSSSYRHQRADGENNPFYIPDMAFGAELGLNNFYMPGKAHDTSFYFLPTYLFYIEFRLNNRFTFESGLGGSVHGPKRLKKTEFTEYDTAGDHHLNVSETIIDRIYYLKVPVILNYSFKERWQISTGAWLSWFLSADNRRQTDYYINDVLIKTDKDKARTTFSDYFNFWDVQIPLSVTYRFNRWLSASATGFAGIFDITPDNKWAPGRNTNSGYTLSVKVRIL